MKERRKEDALEKKFGWYLRHRNFEEMQNLPKTELPERIKLNYLQIFENKKEEFSEGVEHQRDENLQLGKREFSDIDHIVGENTDD